MRFPVGMHGSHKRVSSTRHDRISMSPKHIGTIRDSPAYSEYRNQEGLTYQDTFLRAGELAGWPGQEYPEDR